MSKAKAKIPSQWGPIDVELTRCDGCDTVTQENTAVGWLTATNYGPQVSTLSRGEFEAHFCSFQCLGEYVTAVTGNGQDTS